MATNNANWSEHRYYNEDPFPDIQPALLNSADIKLYMDKGCLIEPGRFDDKRMKPASYEMRFLGELYDWEEKEGQLQQRCRKICDDKFVTLPKNSISYLWTEEQLLLPEYIAARFNLRIRDVHKGLLLGTGPLIDPGFGGRILIPLHNLTDNDYILKGGDGIIWVEFTKVSKNDYWQPNDNNTERPSDLIAFPSEKIIDNPHSYLNKAGVMCAGGVQSAFRGALERAQSVATKANKNVKSIRTWGFLGAGVALLTGVIGIGAVVLSAYQLSNSVKETVDSQSERIETFESRLKDIEAAQSAGAGVSMDEPRNETDETALEQVDAAEDPLGPESPTLLTR